MDGLTGYPFMCLTTKIPSSFYIFHEFKNKEMKIIPENFDPTDIGVIIFFLHIG